MRSESLKPVPQELSSISFIHQSNHIHPYPRKRTAAGRRGEQEKVRDSNIEEEEEDEEKVELAKSPTYVCIQ